MDRERDIADLLAGGEGPHFEGGLAALGPQVGHVLSLDRFGRRAEHGGDQLVLVDLLGSEPFHVSTVPEDGGSVTHPHHLGEAMGDQDRGSTLILPVGQEREDPLGLVGRQGGRDLVEEQDLGIPGDRPGQVDHPQGLERYLPHERAAIETGELQSFEPLAELPLVEPAQAEVLVDAEVRRQRRILEDRCDPGRHRFLRRPESHRLTIHPDRS